MVETAGVPFFLPDVIDDKKDSLLAWEMSPSQLSCLKKHVSYMSFRKDVYIEGVPSTVGISYAYISMS